MDNPPENTRAYARAMLLRSADPAEIDSVDWDSIRFNIRGEDYWPRRRTIDLAHPLHYTKDMTEQCFQDSESLEEILDAMDALNGESRPNENVDDGSLNPHSIYTH